MRVVQLGCVARMSDRDMRDLSRMSLSLIRSTGLDLMHASVSDIAARNARVL